MDTILKQSIETSGSVMNDSRIMNTNLQEVISKVVQVDLEIGFLKAATASSEAKINHLGQSQAMGSAGAPAQGSAGSGFQGSRAPHDIMEKKAMQSITVLGNDKSAHRE